MLSKRTKKYLKIVLLAAIILLVVLPRLIPHRNYHGAAMGAKSTSAQTS